MKLNKIKLYNTINKLIKNYSSGEFLIEQSVSFFFCTEHKRTTIKE